MTNQAQSSGGGRAFPWRIIGWGTAALLLLLPLVANAPWTPSDFVAAAVLLGSVGLGFELIVRKSASLAYRAGAALGVIGVFLTVWVNGAVGMIGSEGNPYNLLFGIVLLVALGGAIGARFQPAGMMRAMMAAGVAQLVIGAFGLRTDTLGAAVSMAMSGIWFLSALLFHSASRQPATN